MANANSYKLINIKFLTQIFDIFHNKHTIWSPNKFVKTKRLKLLCLIIVILTWHFLLGSKFLKLLTESISYLTSLDINFLTGKNLVCFFFLK